MCTRHVSIRDLLFAALVVVLAASSMGGVYAGSTVTILHTNDFHSRFEPVSAYDSVCSAEDNAAGDCFGGYARLATAIADARRRHPDALLLDGGDQFQGSLYYTYYKGQAAAEMMNDLGYDAMTVGNHEFDDGPQVLREFIDNVTFPVLLANADISAEPALADVLQKSTVIEKGGERYGVIGVTPEDTDEIANPGDNISFADPIAAVRAEVEALAGDGVDRIILLSHSGYRLDLKIAAAVEGIDVIVGGHTNTLLSNEIEGAVGPYPTLVGDTAVVQAYAYGRYLGELEVEFDEAGTLVEARGEPSVVDGSIGEDPKVLARVEQLAEPLDAIRSEVIARSAEAIIGDREVCRATECEMGNLVADAMLDRVRDQGVSVALMNAGGIRASIDAGEVTMGEVLTVLPFQNTLSTFTVSGAQLLEALENGVSQVEEGAGRFPQVAGLAFTWDPDKQAGERIVDVKVQRDGAWQTLDPAARYALVSNNYVRGGGDGYDVFVDAEDAYDFGPNLESVVADYMAENAPYEPYVDGRISR